MSYLEDLDEEFGDFIDDLEPLSLEDLDNIEANYLNDDLLEEIE